MPACFLGNPWISAGGQPMAVFFRPRLTVASSWTFSYEAALYHLLNLKFIPKDRSEMLKEQQETASLIARTFHVVTMDEDVHWTLTEQVLTLGFEAYRRGEISRNKLFELAKEVGVAREDVVQALVENMDARSMHNILPG